MSFVGGQLFELAELEREWNRDTTDFHITSTDNVEFFEKREIFTTDGVEGDYFKKLFTGTEEVTTWSPPFNACVIRILLRWIHYRRLDPRHSLETLASVADAAIQYKMLSLKEKLELLLIQRRTRHNVSQIIELADRLTLNSEVKRLCFKLVYENNVRLDIMNGWKWNDCSLGRRLKILNEIVYFVRTQYSERMTLELVEEDPHAESNAEALPSSTALSSIASISSAAVATIDII